MENEEKENLNSQTEEADQTAEETLETTTEETQEENLAETEDVEALKEKNRQLFARAKKAEVENKELKKPKPEAKKEPISAKEDDIEKIVDRKLEERDLSSLEVSDELKKELKTYAKAGGLTLKQAMASDYFNFLKEKEAKTEKIENASIGGKRRAPSGQKFSAENPPKPDMSTPSGRAEWADYLKFLRT